MRRTVILLGGLLVAACTAAGTGTTLTTGTTGPVSTTGPTAGTPTTVTTVPSTTTEPVRSAVFDMNGPGSGITLDHGGDVDIEVITAGDPAQQAARTGNGTALAASDGNSTVDSYMQFDIDDNLIHGKASHARIEVEYLDEGTDTFNLQYDATGGGPYGDGTFKDTGQIVKTGTGVFKTAVFPLCDAYFANRTNGGDFRLADGGDGAETIRRVTVTILGDAGTPAVVNVDSCGANPFDDQPDSDAIQACIDRACSGDAVLFTSGGGDPDYHGYLVDKTIFLVRTSSKSDLTFTSTDPTDHALLTATPNLLGFVVHLYARSGISDAGNIDNITLAHLDLDGNRAERRCFGPDNVGNGVEDNWGSWLPECDLYDDPWCSPGVLDMSGGIDNWDPDQDYASHPESWTTGLTVRDMTLSNEECGTALGYFAAAGVIDSVTVDTAGDHVHGPGCTPTDPDEPPYAWSDGITFSGPDNLITNNTIKDASDVGIVCFGGRDTVISNNTIIATPGNHGMFAAIAVHPWGFGLLSGFQVVGNTVINEADTSCGGIHAGIDIGAQMWGAGCVTDPAPSAIGRSGPCSSTSPPPEDATLCTAGGPCRIWGYIPPGETFTIEDNTVTGAQVNFLVEGLAVDGDLIVSGNVSNSPRMTDWQGDANCTWDGITDTWGPLDFVAHDPTIPGWLDQRIYCER